MPNEPRHSRPMLAPDRARILDQYTGRRWALASAADAYLHFYEQGRGFAINWEAYPRSSLRQALTLPLEPTGTEARCLCEEDFLTAVLWAFISNTPVPTPHAPPEVPDAQQP